VSTAARPGRRAERLVIGVVERVSIPEWGAVNLHARVDTGARSSALHVEHLEELGGGRVRFELAGASPRRRRSVEATVVRRSRVRSTSGSTAARPFVSAKMVLGGREIRVEVGLVDRRHMTYPMLLGRSALAGHFLVDPGRRYVLGTARN
jgi:hypothetical protein